MSPIGISVAIALWKPTVSNTRSKLLAAFLHGELPFPDPLPVRSFNYLLLINISISGFLLVYGGVSDWDRTNNLQLRRLLLYPIELQRQYHKRLYQFLEFLARKNPSTSDGGGCWVGCLKSPNDFLLLVA